MNKKTDINMKTIKNKLFALLSFVLFAGLFLSCTETTDYQPAEPLTGVQVYFPNTVKTKVELSQLESTFNVEVRRIDKTAALTVNITASNTNTDEAYTLPASVSFAAGVDVVNLEIAYDAEKLEYDVFDTISLAISDEALKTVYGNSSITFTAGIPAPWEEIGEGSFTDTWWPGEGTGKMEKHMLEAGRYRIILDDVYDAPVTVDFKVLPAGSKVNNVTTTIPNLVTFASYNTGYFYSTYGEYIWVYHPSVFSSLQDEEKWKYSIATKMSDSGEPEVVQIAPYYYMPGVGGWNYTTYDGIITIIFPGVVLADYTASVSYVGHLTDPNDKHFAIADVTLAADVESAKVAVIAGAVSNDSIAAVIDGSIPSVEITASGRVEFELTETGNYSFIVVTYGDGEAQEVATANFDFAIGTEPAFAAEYLLGDFLGADFNYDDSDDASVQEGSDYPVTIARVAGTEDRISITNIYGGGMTVKATVDFAAKTITTDVESVIWNYGSYGDFYMYDTEFTTGQAVATYTDDGVITFELWELVTAQYWFYSYKTVLTPVAAAPVASTSVKSVGSIRDKVPFTKGEPVKF
jgi:hypothetical protein